MLLIQSTFNTLYYFTLSEAKSHYVLLIDHRKPFKVNAVLSLGSSIGKGCIGGKL